MARAADDRTAAARSVRRLVHRVLPDHWSFMLGEVALYCFAILVVTGTYLTFFFDPSDEKVVYRGRYLPLDGISMSKAFQSTMQISFDVRGGLLIRQVHHWAALLFFAVLVLHLVRTFFTGAFRKPRELTWVIGVTLFVVSLLEGFTGYTLPDDVLSGASLRIAESVVLSIPVIGTWLVFLLCGGRFPGPLLVDHLYIAHVLLIPGLLIALIGAHLALVMRQRHTQPYQALASDQRIAGQRVFPGYATRAVARFAFVAGILAGLGGLAQINPVWLYGPYEPAAVQSNSQSDWYLFFLEGSLRLWPPWEFRGFGHTVPAVFFPGVILPLLIFTLTAAYPFLERRMTGDRSRHHVLQRPRDAPVRSGIGAAGLTFWAVLELMATDDMVTSLFHLAIEPVVYTMRVAVIALPPVAFLITYRRCRRLARQENDDHQSTDGTGTFVRLPDGDYGEIAHSAATTAGVREE
jgi:ubiquinol-cytochrome c reductase cytochrome b subunit